MKLFYCCLFILMLILGLLNHFNMMNGDTLLNLRFEAAAISNGEYWRLFSGHLVHLNLIHTAMNLGALCLLMIMFWKDLSYREDLTALLFSIAGISFSIYFFSPELTNYAGFSGVLHGLFIYYILKTLPQNQTVSILTIGIIATKIIWEQSPWVDNSKTAELIGGSVATMSHLYGGVCGLLAGFNYLVFQKNIKGTNPCL